MIVVGILTAITIEHYYTLSHKRHLAEKAAEQVHAEIRANLESVTQGIEKNQKRLQLLLSSSKASFQIF